MTGDQDPSADYFRDREEGDATQLVLKLAELSTEVGV